MVKEGVVEKLIELQRSKGKLFAGCMARFTVQLEVEEGLRQREKRGFKGEILGKVKKAFVSDAEVAAKVSWGSSP
ncbi:hypothetical protein Fmac_031528 [Flemingia macrophylla]|uniref:Uncharacterized protein n=1 Tax=Flemingia macrophylla TaxID=520843 RepID=A0ABD1L2A7_9FABA